MPCLQPLLILFGLGGITKFGLDGITKGKFNITKNLYVSGSDAFILGIILLIGGVLSHSNGIWALPTLGLVIAVGVIRAKPTGVGLDTKIVGRSPVHRIIVGVALGLGLIMLFICSIPIIAVFGSMIGRALK